MMQLFPETRKMESLSSSLFSQFQVKLNNFFFLQRGIVDTKSKVSYRFMNDCVSLSGLTKDSSIDYSPTI